MASEFTGRILHVNLTTGMVEVESPPESFYRTYLGGSAMGLYYILKGMQPGTDGLDPANVMTWMDSLLTGTPIAGQSRITINARSPLTDGVGDSQGGGFLPAELRFAGFTGIVIRGRATEPVYLWIHDGEAELRPAGHLWGRTTTETVDTLRAELGDPRIEVAAIGPSGEKLVRLAAIINMGNRANGRTGMGAVMGSKNLKAVAVRGTNRKAPLADTAALGKLARWGSREIPNNGDVIGPAQPRDRERARGPARRRRPADVQLQRRPVRALRGHLRRDDDGHDPHGHGHLLLLRRALQAGRDHRVRAAGRSSPGTAARSTRRRRRSARTAASTTSPRSRWPTRSATSTASTRSAPGATIAWTMECFEHGLVTEADLGFRAPFGDAAAMVRLTEMIATRDGFGDVLANGSRKAADLLGKGHEFLITVKGAEAPAHMPQAKRSLGVIYAVNPFGADHQSSEHDPMIEEGASELYMERLRLLGLRRGAGARLAGARQGPVRAADPAVLLVPRHRLAVPVRVGPGVGAVRAAGDGRLRAGRDRLGGLRRRGADGDRRAAPEHAARVQRPGGPRPQGRPAARQVLQAAHRAPGPRAASPWTTR